MNGKLLKICYSAVVAALVCVTTMFTKFLLIPGTEGYVHLGDAFIFIGVYLLGIYAVPAAALGSMFADLFGGFSQWAVWTLLIKGAIALVFWLITLRHRDGNMLFTIVGAIVASCVMVAGYFVAEVVLYGVAPASLSALNNLIQAAFAAVLTPVAVLALRAVHFKRLVKIR